MGGHVTGKVKNIYMVDFLKEAEREKVNARLHLISKSLAVIYNS